MTANSKCESLKTPESTKTRKNANTTSYFGEVCMNFEFFRAFVLSCFRDSFFDRRETAMADHAWVNENLDTYLAGDLTTAERESVEQHVAACEACQQALAEARRLEQLMNGLFTEARPVVNLDEPRHSGDGARSRYALRGVGRGRGVSSSGPRQCWLWVWSVTLHRRFRNRVCPRWRMSATLSLRRILCRESDDLCLIKNSVSGAKQSDFANRRLVPYRTRSSRNWSKN